MTEWYLINPQPTLNSGFEKDEFTDYAQDGFDELLTETQLGKAIKFCKGKFDGKNFVESKLNSPLTELTIGKLMPSEFKIYLLNK